MLVVATVLMLLLPSVETDSLDNGLRLPDIPPWDSALGARLTFEGDGDDTEGEIRPRYAEGAEGLEVRRFSFSLSFTGDGESSMISTHPEVSLAGVRLFSPSESMLCLRVFKVLVLSGEGIRWSDDEELEAAGEDMPEGPAFGVWGALPLSLLVTLAMRNRGTRVCIFCSRTLTRARISDTI